MMMGKLIILYGESKALLVKLEKHASRLIKYLYQLATLTITNIRKQIPTWSAQAWQYYYRLINKVLELEVKYRIIITIIILLSLVVANWLFFPDFNRVLEHYFSTQNRFSGLQVLFVSLGGAMIGATAIAFSLIMFAMQVNVERMPHGLFKKFSSDFKLLGSFAITFFLAIFITSLSLIPDNSWVTLAVLVATWCLMLLLIFLILAYRRALDLISPTKQLYLLTIDTKKDLNRWSKAASRLAPLLEPLDNEQEQEKTFNHDLGRVTYFELYPFWTANALNSISHCMSYARRYAEHGDHEVSKYSLNSVVSINNSYIKAKGSTFFSNHMLLEDRLTTDSFINEVLEQMRQTLQLGLSRGDELLIEQAFRTLHDLCLVYSTIDYGREYENKFHAFLATGYLSDALESTLPHNMPDVLMEGLRLLGKCSLILLSKRNTEYITSISEKIGIIGCTGSINKKYQPVTQIAVKQLAILSFELIRCNTHDINYALSEVLDDVILVSKFIIKTPDSQINSSHRNSLAPYFSLTSNDALLSWLTELCNALSDANENDENAKRVIYHIEEWSDDLYLPIKDLFVLSITNKSGLAFDISHWIVHAFKLLLAVSNASSCTIHSRDELRSNSSSLIAILSWVPDDQESITFIENYQLTELLFEAAVDANQRDCIDIAYDIRNMLVSWAFKGGRHQTGWSILEKSCYALACLNIIFDLDDSVILNLIENNVSKTESPDVEVRRRACRDITREAGEVRHREFEIRQIYAAMAELDQNRLRTLLLEIANKLTPEDQNTQN